MSRWIVWAALPLMVLSCDESSGGEPDTADTAGTADTADTAAEMSEEEIQKADIPVEEDFEEEAREKISTDNLDEKVSELEDEIEDGE